MGDESYHYQVIARAIGVLETGQGDMSLAALAQRCGMSVAHFQRVFSACAGISPKQYQQFRRLVAARALLRSELALPEVAEALDLSGTGRLYDLMIRWEAMTPGDYARRGQGRRIGWAFVDSPFGRALVMATGTGICGLGFAVEQSEAAVFADLTARWPGAEFEEASARIEPLAQAAFSGGGAALHLIGAPFRLKVWEALLSIPPGEVLSYGGLAGALGQPGAARAVGQAVGANPVALLIPCHRVIRATGAFGGYHWGAGVKAGLLQREGVAAVSQ
ncbi:bifunctional helix-turn-helix domain-containing protein/methylated-DNA--[protein]-cysteine S-methyltransferase [Falsigemmobacter faecalis]|uniref:methylated-DNA--[protein]-cysteine S-methyltransferase n=1 Tax=Falsigemmobacter faecalis TaxID=2488730 RepID=A0A3P3DJG8_9RHOB|nr:methylated-DNA--[protein]-cysteine S-methyltransferase [Falsigemmobacter faecalis]RRH73974.1 methylated-DNA--[protein]-cysteine S-methyltransferase [Falsigemmobacter faecalis]